MSKSIGRKSIFVTGAASGIGKATAKLFADRSWFVGLYDIDETGLKTLVQEIGEENCVWKKLDVRSREDWAAGMEHFSEATGSKLDVLFNNAGIARHGWFEAISGEDNDLMVDINVKGVLNGVGAVVGASDTARVTAGFPCWLKTNETSTNVTAPSYSGSTPTGASQVWKTFGTPTAFTETMLKATMQECYESGGEPSMLMVGPFNKTAVSAFSGIASSRYNVDGAEPSVIIGAADIYVSDFGNLSVVPNRFFTSVIDAGSGSLMNNWAFLIDPDEVKIASLRPYTIESLAKTGDADKRMALREWGLQVNNKAAHGGIAGITPAQLC